MVSFAFLLCSTLLLSGAIAAPHPDETADINEFTEKLQLKELAVDDAADLSVELKRSLGQEAAQAAVKVLTDLLDGKDLHKSILDRGIEALDKVDGTLASFGKSFLKRLRELINGTPIEVVAGNIWKSVQKKFAGKSKNFDEIVEAVGIDNVTKFVEGTTKIIKEYIISVIRKRNQQRSLENLAKIAVAGH